MQLLRVQLLLRHRMIMIVMLLLSLPSKHRRRHRWVLLDLTHTVVRPCHSRCLILWPNLLSLEILPTSICYLASLEKLIAVVVVAGSRSSVTLPFWSTLQTRRASLPITMRSCGTLLVGSIIAHVSIIIILWKVVLASIWLLCFLYLRLIELLQLKPLSLDSLHTLI